MSKLDPDQARQQLFLTMGGVYMLLRSSENQRDKDLSEELWKQIPFISAIARVSARYEAEVLAEWRTLLQQPMPYGGEPLGLPKDEEP